MNLTGFGPGGIAYVFDQTSRGYNIGTLEGQTDVQHGVLVSKGPGPNELITLTITPPGVFTVEFDCRG